MDGNMALDIVGSLAGVVSGALAVSRWSHARMKSMIREEISDHALKCLYPSRSHGELNEVVQRFEKTVERIDNDRKEDSRYFREKLDWIVTKLRNGGPG